MRRIPHLTTLTTAALALTIATTGCTTVSAPDTTPDIAGPVTQVTTFDGGVSLLVESGQPQVGDYDIASVSVDTDAEVLVMEDGDLVRATYEDIPNGARVEVWFEGPVAESYPVQATAGTVVVLGS